MKNLIAVDSDALNVAIKLLDEHNEKEATMMLCTSSMYLEDAIKEKVDTALSEYSKEVGISVVMTIDELIDSHRRLVTLNREFILPTFTKERDARIATYIENVIVNQYVLEEDVKSKLRKFTIAELVKWLEE